MSAVPSTQYEPFSISVVPGRSEVAVVPSGELDLACADDLAIEGRRLFEVGFDRVLVDLRRLTFIDSTGLRALMTLQTSAHEAGGKLTLVPGPWQVQRIFEVTATRDLFAWRDY